jgi:hypothetical protein
MATNSVLVYREIAKNTIKWIPYLIFIISKFSKTSLHKILDNLDNENSKISVVLLVYDVMNQESKLRLENYWLPKITEANEEVPIIIVGNKVDLRPSHFEDDLESIITPLIMKYRQVEMGIE